MLEMAEYMAMGTATRARRKELRESSDPAVRRWCDLVAKMIDRLPQNRPAASLSPRSLAPRRPGHARQAPERPRSKPLSKKPGRGRGTRTPRPRVAGCSAGSRGGTAMGCRRSASGGSFQDPQGPRGSPRTDPEIENQVRYRRQLGEQLRRSTESLAAGNIAEARRLAGQVERETEHPDLVEEARRLRERIAEEERRLLERQAKIEQARARADSLLADAKQEFGKDTQDSLQEAERRVAQALAIPEISPQQRDRGRSSSLRLRKGSAIWPLKPSSARPRWPGLKPIFMNPGAPGGRAFQEGRRESQATHRLGVR